MVGARLGHLMRLSQPSEVGDSTRWHQSPLKITRIGYMHHQLQPSTYSTVCTKTNSHILGSNLTSNLEPLLAPQSMCVSRDNPAPLHMLSIVTCNHKRSSTKWGRMPRGTSNENWFINTFVPWITGFLHLEYASLHSPRGFDRNLSICRKPPLALAKDVHYHTNVAASLLMLTSLLSV